MMSALRRRSRAILLLLATAGLSSCPVHAEPIENAVDASFAKFGAKAPGCAVGVERDGRSLVRAFGSADLEHDVANTDNTVFEAGSVSKQFTATAILLLAKDGKLSLDDDIHRFLPELPDFGSRISIDDLLHHVSGLRDWGEIEDITGWPRGDRVYGLPDVLSILSDQRHLNFEPGTRWSYSNSGYTLAAIIVERASSQTLATFSRDRIFAPLGMTHSQWRDNFRRIVPNRAIAFRSGNAGYEQDMPFENAYGHGGMLTTIGDLLVWNRALTADRLGISRELSSHARLRDGTVTDYTRGLFDVRYRQHREIAHSGATAGYRAWLGRYPDDGISVALLCNDGDINPVRLAHDLVDRLLFEGTPSSSPPPSEVGRSRNHSRSPGPAEGAAMVGTYRSEEARATIDIRLFKGAFQISSRERAGRSIPLAPTSDGTFRFDDETLRPIRDAAGAIVALSISSPRVWALRFDRTP